MKRKFKVNLTVFLVLIPLLPAVFAVGCKEEKPKHEVGLQLWSIRDAMFANPDSTIEVLGTSGYSYVEAAGYGDGKFYNMEPEAFKALVEANGMTFLGSHCGHDAPDSTNWDEVMAWWDTCIDAHKRAGVQYIVQPSMGHVAYESLEGLKQYCDYFNAVGEKCNEAGIEFGYHNHDAEFKSIDSTVIYDFMLHNTDADKVHFQTDLYWIKVGGGDAVHYFTTYPGRFFSYHIKDEAELGESGTMDFQPAFDVAEKAGVKYYVVEVERYNMTPLESVAKSYTYLQDIGFAK